MSPEQEKELAHGFARVINAASVEGDSGTPDFILGLYLVDCLRAFGYATGARETWREGRR